MNKVKYLPFLLAFAIAWCDSGNLSTASKPTVFGKCRYCGNPGYSLANYASPSAAQQAYDEGDKGIAGTIVCGKCRADMMNPKGVKEEASK